ncbi:MAG: hypothetical protein M5R40_07350 [Anaerolineae bacterium]|nr:hypothetical protein [Anaerolineae bacterium]
MEGYAHSLISDLLLRQEGPVPVIGYVTLEDTGAFGPGMMDAGARYFFSLARPPAATDLVRRMGGDP